MRRLILSERNFRYASPMPIEEDKIDYLIDLVIDEHRRFLEDEKYEIDWAKISLILNDDDFLIKMKSYSKENPEHLYETYMQIRDDNLMQDVAAVLDTQIKTADNLYKMDVEKLNGKVKDEIVDLAIELVKNSDFGPEHFSELEEVIIREGDFIGVFNPGNETVMGLNPKKLEIEAENLMEEMELESDIDKEHLMSLVLGEAFVHEATHSHGDKHSEENCFPGEKAADISSRKYLKSAIDYINKIRQGQDLPPLPMETDREGVPLEEEKCQ